MSKILLDYVFPVTAITPTPQASTSFLKQVCVVAKPKSGQEGNVGNVYPCTNMTQVAARTDNTNSQQLFNAGMSKVFILLADDLDLATALSTHLSEFYTLLISDDFIDDDVSVGIVTAEVAASLKIQDILYTAATAGVAGNSITVTYTDDGTAGAETVDVSTNDIEVHMEAGVSTAQQIADAIEASVPATALVTVSVDVGDESDVQADAVLDNLEGGVDEVTGGGGLDAGEFNGVIGVSTQDASFAGDQAVIENRVGFISNVTNKAKNMFFAFGSLLSNPSNWLNQQYISMPYNDDVDELGEANSYFDDKVSFVLNDDEFANRLALFATGGKAIVAPYIIKNLMIDLQSAALTWISGNQPQYTIKEASLLETRLQQDVIDSYIARQWISDGTVAITLVNDNFVANGAIDVSEPKALWRVFSELRQTL